IHGLKIVAVAVVAHAILGMAKKLTPDVKRKTIALFALVVALLWQTAFIQIGIILIAAFVGFFLYQQHQANGETDLQFPISCKFGVMCITLFFGLLIGLPRLFEVISFY